MTTAPETGGVEPRSRRHAEAVAGFLAAAAIALSCVAVAYRPARLTPIALVIALIAVGIGGRSRRLAAIAVGAAAVGWFVGMIVAAITKTRSTDRAPRVPVPREPMRRLLQRKRVTLRDVDGLNAGYARLLLERVPRGPRSRPGRVARALRERRQRARRGASRAGASARAAASGDGGQRRADDGARPAARAAGAAHAPAEAPTHAPDDACSAASRPRWRSSRRTGCTATSQRDSTRSARSRPATRRSSRSASSRS